MKKDKYHILYVDDEERNLTVFVSTFRRDYKVFTALSGTRALEIMDENEIHLVISDQKMPKMTGLELLGIVALKYPEVGKIILTAHADMQNVIKAINNYGIYRYIIKPWKKEEFALMMEEALELYQLKKDKFSLLQKLQCQNDKLEIKVKKRTEELEQNNLNLTHTNQKLQESEYKLNQLNQIKDKLLSIVSHDSRAPLATLSGFIDLFIGSQYAFSHEETLKISKDIKYSVDNLRILLDNLLTWSYAQIGNQKIKIEVLPICEMIGENEKLFRPAMVQKGLYFEMIPLNEAAYVKADKDMLDFIIRNLINNAIKFSNKGDKITIHAEKFQDVIKINIIDTGIGIPSEYLAVLFEEGEYISTYGTANEKGTGLGLSLSSDFIKQQNGSIEVQSIEGEGSTFSFTIPLA